MSKKYLVVKGHCGLGNRLHCLVGAIVYSKLTGRELIVDWSDGMYGKEGENSFEQLIKCEYAKTDLGEIIDSKSVYPSIWSGKLDKTINQIGSHPDWIKQNIVGLPSCSLKDGGYSSDVIVFCSFRHDLHHIPKELFLNSEFAGMEEDEMIRYVFENYINIAPLVKEKTKEFQSKYLDKPAIGIHVRYSDLPVGRSNKKYHQALGTLLKKYPDLRIFIATDSRNVLHEFKTMYPNVHSLNKWYPDKAGKPIHYSCDTNDCLQMGVDAMADMFLLGTCDYLIYCKYSSFTFYTLYTTSISQENIIPIGTGDMSVNFYWRLKGILRIKQRLCCSFLKRRTIFKKPINLIK